MAEQDEKWNLPKKFRLTKKLLKEADERQKEWANDYNQPFASLSPQARERGRAAMIAHDDGVSDNERAEAFATLGRFDIAAEYADGAELTADFIAIWHAVLKDDGDWCAHPKQAQYVERDVYSVRHQQDAHLLRCNTCGFRNLVPVLPDHIAEGRRKRQESRRAAKGMTPLQARSLLKR